MGLEKVGQRWQYNGPDGIMIVEIVNIQSGRDRYIEYRIVQNISVNQKNHTVGNVLCYYHYCFFPEVWNYLEGQDRKQE